MTHIITPKILIAPCSSTAAAATCGALRITAPVARKPLGAPFGRVLQFAGEALHPYVVIYTSYGLKSELHFS